MATVVVGPEFNLPNSAALSTAQTGNGSSTNIFDRGGSVGPALVTIVTTVGATPTVTVAIEGSADGSDWWAIPYADYATPNTLAVTTFTITTASTNRKILLPDYPWRYGRLTYSSNTNVTLTANVYMFTD